MIVVTGAAGFISSCLIAALNEQGREDLILSDDFSREDKLRNWTDKQFIAKVDRDIFPAWLDTNQEDVEVIFHLGARTDTTEQDEALFDRLNLHYTQQVWERCQRYDIPLIYASSAATYGAGEHGYQDNHSVIDQLTPLNPYGRSKNDFDKWALQQDQQPRHWYGLKFFNVYGPNEYHKGRMASVIFHTFRQIQKTGAMKLFRSHRPDFKDGEQSRDFIYVKDVVKMMIWLWQNTAPNGLYNIGTGQARTFYDLAANTFKAQGLTPDISFIDTPLDIRDTYQYFTEADMDKLHKAGYPNEYYTLEEGIADYVQGYLAEDKVW
ncbi:ADP-glyceromanno-heptose 6-epimerase [Lewinella cohaerens]|uniref:ADP-glyceromanno-heptose 6-epimerase n=1 Tax=Lewinella cohaerens TaxID=70995 RepID=UPI0003670282|nr:ADP-glyceromanno-heptose 6-epimerase [Lewinella cohaerens]